MVNQPSISAPQALLYCANHSISGGHIARILSAARETMSFNKPTQDEWKSVERYVWNNKPVDEKETAFVYRKDDLITLRPGKERAWLDSSVEKGLRWLNCRPIEVRRPQPLRASQFFPFCSPDNFTELDMKPQWLFCSKVSLSEMALSALIPLIEEELTIFH